MTIAFLDIEVGTTSKKIDKLGYLSEKLAFESTSLSPIKEACLSENINFICGHNFVEHDRKFLAKTSFNTILEKVEIIDTLYLSMLLRTNKRIHKLNKPYKDTQINIENQPLGDSEQTKALFDSLNQSFDELDENMQNVFYQLLKDDTHFSGFFSYKNYKFKGIDVYQQIQYFLEIDKTKYLEIEKQFPIETAFIISFLWLTDKGSMSSIILNRYPGVVELLKKMTFNKNSVDINGFTKNEFNISKFREFDNRVSGDLFDSGKISQEEIIKAAIGSESLLAILPTGGGKTITFQIPALIKAQKYKGLSVVISPLQALMKDQIDSFKRKNNNFKVVAISGYLSPIERMNAISEVENGIVDMLYLAPEALRSNSIFNALKHRVIDRFIIDEAHCFSSWGHDFRHDYYFIANTIKELEKSNFQPRIPVSCFTATAKPEVIRDIKEYFQDNLDLSLKEFIASIERYNLDYSIVKTETEIEKYEKLIDILSGLDRNENNKNPTIIYIPQNAKECKELSNELEQDERLAKFDLVIEPFYSKLDEDRENGNRSQNSRGKSDILADFISNKVNIVIATTAFGMGIDKPDIQTVIHYQQSDSLESYLQESGRGARDENLRAKCIVLYSKTDFDRSFNQLNRSKVDLAEIKRIVAALKKYDNRVLNLSPKDIAKKMGVDIEDSSINYEVIIKTALLELEKYEIIERGRDGYKIFATSIKKENKKEAMPYVHEVLDPKKDKDPYIELYQDMILVMQNIIQRSKLDPIEVDDLSDIVGVEKSKIFKVLFQLQKDGLLKFDNDISVYIKKSVRKDFDEYFKVERKVLDALIDTSNYDESINLRSLNDPGVNNVLLFKQIIQSWSHLTKLKGSIFTVRFKNDFCFFQLKDKSGLRRLIKARKNLAGFIVEQLLDRLGDNKGKEIEFSSNKIKLNYDSDTLTLEAFHHTFVHLHEMLKSFELRRGRLIYYQTLQLNLKNKIKEERVPYKAGDYNDGLKQYYKRKIEAIHIQIAFLEKLLEQGWGNTKKFVKDYFSEEYSKFKKIYKLNDQEIGRPVTKEKYRKILEDLNSEQKEIFDDNYSHSIMVLAGPGSGKTKTLVHKIASLITIEGNKAEYFLMLAHSRVAVLDFKDKLKQLIGNQAYDVQIHTFHSFAISLLGKSIDEDADLQGVIIKAAKLLEDGVVKLPFINMLVVDEYQDVGMQSYAFINAIYNNMGDKGDKKIIVVGDDDQCIKNFGDDKADIAYIQKFEQDFSVDSEYGKSKFSKYQLLTNYRSRANIVDFFNKFSTIIGSRLKTKKLLSFSKIQGDVALDFYQSGDYHLNLLNSIRNSNSDNIAVLARNNDEVLSIYSMLIDSKIKARYITSENGFKLGNLVELQDFLQDWKNTKDFEESRKRSDIIYQESQNNHLKNQVIDGFEDEYQDEIKRGQSHFVNLFTEYLSLINFDEFSEGKSTVIVSTMHKAKGQEWDEVYLCADTNFISQYDPQVEYDKRLAYVAITRAKNNLYIHSKTPLFNQFIEPTIHNTSEESLDTVVLMMGLNDVALTSEYSEKGISRSSPMAGQMIDVVDKQSYINLYKEGWQVAALSKKMIEKIRQKQKIGYSLSRVEIENVVEWLDKKSGGKKYKQVLCKIYLSKDNVI
ncbi:MAG: RecQ family ATP-dependent DNA helicase [Candidatus Thioglobus sp.]|jgi:ATP-dependent DNA helicase RecQ|nr:RecQ family ATP-dependent DNA helicase [Candidatus Thioglobus sp.]MBT3744911.1 RecQ family ATP-dependent DNA helicase [Candidatus Thioglobus sp.]